MAAEANRLFFSEEEKIAFYIPRPHPTGNIRKVDEVIEYLTEGRDVLLSEVPGVDPSEIMIEVSKSPKYKGQRIFRVPSATCPPNAISIPTTNAAS